MSGQEKFSVGGGVSSDSDGDKFGESPVLGKIGQEAKKVKKPSGPEKSTTARRSKGGSGSEDKKRTDEESDEDLEEWMGGEPMEVIGDILKKMESWLNDQVVKRKTMPRAQERRCKRYIGVIRECTSKIRVGFGRLEERLDVKESMMADMVNIVGEAMKAAVQKIEETMMTKLVELGKKVSSVDSGKGSGEENVREKIPEISVLGQNKKVGLGQHQVMIKKEGRTGEEVKTLVQRILRPVVEGLRVRKLVKVRNGVMLELGSLEEVETVVGNRQMMEAELVMETVRRRRPVVKIFDVDISVHSDEEQVVRDIFQKNKLGNSISWEEFTTEFLVKRKFNEGSRGSKKEGKENWIVECSGRVRNWIRAEGRVYIGWESCKVVDYVDLPRCFKCQGYGHVVKFCRMENEVCGRCAKEHSTKGCKVEGEEISCVNCKREGVVQRKHMAGWTGCPVYKRAVERYMERIDYDQELD